MKFDRFSDLLLVLYNADCITM